MERFIATEIPQKPFIYWQTYDGTDANPLVLDEADLPENQFGVCPLKIVAGQLEERTVGEMAAFEAEYETEQANLAYEQKENTLDTAVFAYSGNNFPMHNTARLYYGVIAHTAGNYKVLNADGAQVDVLDADRTAFLDAYFNEIKTLTQP